MKVEDVKLYDDVVIHVVCVCISRSCGLKLLYGIQVGHCEQKLL